MAHARPSGHELAYINWGCQSSRASDSRALACLEQQDWAVTKGEDATVKLHLEQQDCAVTNGKGATAALRTARPT